MKNNLKDSYRNIKIRYAKELIEILKDIDYKDMNSVLEGYKVEMEIIGLVDMLNLDELEELFGCTSRNKDILLQIFLREVLFTDALSDIEGDLAETLDHTSNMIKIFLSGYTMGKTSEDIFNQLEMSGR